MNITGIVITLNEELNIKDCIQSLKTVCDEIIIVDSQSTDKTIEIAKTEGAIVVEQKYLGDGPQKKFAVPNAKNDWILSLDADERVSEEMQYELQSLKLSDESIAFSFPRKNYVGKHWIKAGGFHPDRKVRLFNRKTANYEDKKHHAKINYKNKVKLKGSIIHFTYKDMSHWVDRINWLSGRDAKSMFNSGKSYSACRPISRALIAFIRKFFLKLGFLQGRDGFLITLTTTFRTYLKYEKLNELHESAND